MITNMGYRNNTRKYYRMKQMPLVIVSMVILMVFYILTTILAERQNRLWMGLEDSYNNLFEEERYRRDLTVYNITNNTNETTPIRSQFPMDIFTLEQKRMGAIILHIIGVIYMFVALALVCDEFFVPSLEIITEKLKIPYDVAGATFMAAGGSAPEFFTSLFGIFFAQNSIGFGTIVGSAVFNILFVIGLCGLFAKGGLLLTWWPLFRDTLFYTIDLAILIGFFQNGGIEWHEALVLFILYLLYVSFMFINGRAEKAANKLMKIIKDKLCFCTIHSRCSTRVDQVADLSTDQETGSIKLGSGTETPSSCTSNGVTPAPIIMTNLEGHDQLPNVNSQKIVEISGGFELQTLPEPRTQALTIHSRNSIDSGFQTLSELGSPATVNTPSVFFSPNSMTDKPIGDTTIDTVSCEKELSTFSGTKISSDKKCSIIKSKSSRSLTQSSRTKSLIILVEPVEGPIANDNEEDEEDDGIVDIRPPKTWCKRIQYVLFFPLIILLFFTLPNVRKPRWRWWFPWVFVGSILWIGIFSYFMVWWATEFGETAGIPPSVMGITFLAAGTSIPDLISSVIVARKGRGDMAVSSSIGSNIFDITVGLPVPWLLYSAVNNGIEIQVMSTGLFCSVILLVGMLLLTIISIAVFRWKLGKLLGIFFMVMYVIFVTMAILLELVIHCSISGA